jgi:O-antigen/teichoic acid export membrane protein
MTERGSRSALTVAAGAAVAAVGGIVFLAIVSRSTSTEQNTAFLTYWAALFAVFAVLAGVQNEMTRAVRADADVDASSPRPTSPLRTGLLVGVGAGIVVAALFPLWQNVLVGIGDPLIPVLIMVGAALLYAGHVATVGTLAGRGRWAGFATLTAGEAVVRVVLAALAAILGWGLVGFETAAAGGTLTWLAATTLIPGWRSLWRLRIALPLGALLRRILNAMAASGGSAVLVTGFPLLMSLTTDAASYRLAAPFIVAVSVTRAPLLIPVNAFQSMVIASFVGRPERALATLLRLIGAILVVAVAGGILAALVGPWLMTLVFGARYGNSPVVLALLVVAAALLALLVLGGSIALALDAHTVNTLGWYLALIVSAAVMLIPADLEVRSILALALGPLAGAVLHFGYVLRALRRRAREVA